MARFLLFKMPRWEVMNNMPAAKYVERKTIISTMASIWVFQIATASSQYLTFYLFLLILSIDCSKWTYWYLNENRWVYSYNWRKTIILNDMFYLFLLKLQHIGFHECYLLSGLCTKYYGSKECYICQWPKYCKYFIFYYFSSLFSQQQLILVIFA